MVKYDAEIRVVPGDVIIAKGPDLDSLKGLSVGHRVRIEIIERLDYPEGNDTFKCIVNGQYKDIHIDVFSNLSVLAEELSVTRQ